MKKILAAVLALAIVLTLALSLPVPASAESLYIRKIVSVVYDDSGSMSGASFAYANYAMQAFCGMLNSEDKLFITYMNSGGPYEMDLSAGGIQSSLDQIRGQYCGGGTPFGAVETAFAKLQSVPDSNPNTQYWLVVITDGEFGDVSSSTSFLNGKFHEYTNTTMPNGTQPQVTFLAIGSGVTAPDKNENQGIFVERAADAGGIVQAMNNMADRISGRTRLSSGDITLVDSQTIQVSSAIPLLNIAIFAQQTEARITQVTNSDGSTIPIARSAQLRYDGYDALQAGAYLLGDSQNVIVSGTYRITFDQAINLDDLVILYEPALETRMTILVNGQEVTDMTQLQNLMENDMISVSCKIYEMGTDKEVDPSLLPPGTDYSVTISENGQVVQQTQDDDMSLGGYTLRPVATEITAAVTIAGFNPITYTVKFTPAVFVPKTVYTLSAAFGSSTKSVKYDQIGGSHDLSIVFTAYADGVPITDPEEVKALNPVIEASPQGNGGVVSYEPDGTIVFRPDRAPSVGVNAPNFSVTVTCSIDGGATASETYMVLVADYRVVPVDTDETIQKNGFHNNTVGVSFYITKDGVQLTKDVVEQGITVLLNEAHSQLKTRVEVAPDGIITVTPYCEDTVPNSFWHQYGIYWWHYWGMEGDDVTITLSHIYGAAESTIDVVQAPLNFRLMHIWLPLGIEVLILAIIIFEILALLFKPRFSYDYTIYYGEFMRDSETGKLVVNGWHSTLGGAENSFFRNFSIPFFLRTPPQRTSLGGGMASVELHASSRTKIKAIPEVYWFISNKTPHERSNTFSVSWRPGGGQREDPGQPIEASDNMYYVYCDSFCTNANNQRCFQRGVIFAYERTPE